MSSPCHPAFGKTDYCPDVIRSAVPRRYKKGKGCPVGLCRRHPTKTLECVPFQQNWFQTQAYKEEDQDKDVLRMEMLRWNSDPLDWSDTREQSETSEPSVYDDPHPRHDYEARVFAGQQLPTESWQMIGNWPRSQQSVNTAW